MFSRKSFFNVVVIVVGCLLLVAACSPTQNEVFTKNFSIVAVGNGNPEIKPYGNFTEQTRGLLIKNGGRICFPAGAIVKGDNYGPDEGLLFHEEKYGIVDLGFYNFDTKILNFHPEATVWRVSDCSSSNPTKRPPSSLPAVSVPTVPIPTPTVTVPIAAPTKAPEPTKKPLPANTPTPSAAPHTITFHYKMVTADGDIYLESISDFGYLDPPWCGTGEKTEFAPVTWYTNDGSFITRHQSNALFPQTAAKMTGYCFYSP